MGFTNEELKSKLQAIVKDSNSGAVARVVSLQHQEIGTSTVPKNLTVHGDASISSNVSVSENASVGNEFYVSGSSFFSNSFVSGTLTITGSSVTSGSSRITGTLDVNTGANQALFISGGNVGVGNKTMSSGGGTGIVFVSDVTTAPTSNPTSGTLVYNDSGHFKARGAVGNVYNLGQVSQRLSSNFTTSNTTATATNLTFAVDANSVWRFEYRGSAKSSDAGGIRYQITAPSGASVEAQLLSMLGYGGTPQITTLEFTTVNSLNSSVHVGNADVVGPDVIAGTISIGSTTGNVTIAAAIVNAAQTATILAGAYLVANRADNV